MLFVVVVVMVVVVVVVAVVVVAGRNVWLPTALEGTGIISKRNIMPRYQNKQQRKRIRPLRLGVLAGVGGKRHGEMYIFLGLEESPEC